MGKFERIQVPPEDRERLERLVKDRNTPQKIVWRSRMYFWPARQWRGRGGTESGQERAHGAPLAATLCGQRGGRAVEGRHPPARAQAERHQPRVVWLPRNARAVTTSPPLAQDRRSPRAGALLLQFWNYHPSR